VQTSKFDGEVSRPLHLWEAAQVAGRAGRGTADGFVHSLAVDELPDTTACDQLLCKAVALANGDPGAATDLQVDKGYLSPRFADLKARGALAGKGLIEVLGSWCDEMYQISFPSRSRGSSFKCWLDEGLGEFALGQLATVDVDCTREVIRAAAANASSKHATKLAVGECKSLAACLRAAVLAPDDVLEGGMLLSSVLRLWRNGHETNWAWPPHQGFHQVALRLLACLCTEPSATNDEEVAASLRDQLGCAGCISFLCSSLDSMDTHNVLAALATLAFLLQTCRDGSAVKEQVRRLGGDDAIRDLADDPGSPGAGEIKSMAHHLHSRYFGAAARGGAGGGAEHAGPAQKKQKAEALASWVVPFDQRPVMRRLATITRKWACDEAESSGVTQAVWVLATLPVPEPHVLAIAEAVLEHGTIAVPEIGGGGAELDRDALDRALGLLGSALVAARLFPEILPPGLSLDEVEELYHAGAAQVSAQLQGTIDAGGLCMRAGCERPRPNLRHQLCDGCFSGQ
jgi:hypothetical protein